MTENDYKPKFSKPGKKPKPAKIKNSRVRLHDITKPDQKECRICEPGQCKEDIKTQYFHHYEGTELKHRAGKGTSVKVSDLMTAWAAHKCGTELSIKPDKDAPRIVQLEYELRWMKAILLTHNI